MRSAPAAVLAALAVGLVGAPPAEACGLPLGAKIPFEQALVSFSGGREEIVASLQLEGGGSRAAVLFPVPTVPRVEPADPATFSYLDSVTRIPTEESDEDGNVGAAPPSGGGVNVIGRELVGGYDVARLSAEDPRALQRWLDDNGFAPPVGAEPILRSYTAQDWKFVAIKLAKGRSPDGELSPLRMSFASKRIVYPVRLNSLAKRHLALRLYVAADREVEIPRLRTIYAGRVSELERPPPAGVRRLLRAPFLTRMERDTLDPSDLRADLVARPVREGGGDGGGPSTAAWLAIGLGGAALIAAAAALAAASVRRRRA